MKEYKIQMGNAREDHTIYYQEMKDGEIIKELAAATDVNFKKFGLGKSKVTLYLNSFQKWDVNKEELSSNEYMIVLKRIYDFLKSEGFEIDFDMKDSIWK